MDLGEVLGIFASIIGLFIFGVKLLLGDWFKKSSELEALKKKYTDKIQDKLTEDLKNLRIIVDLMKNSVKEVTLKMDRTDSKMDDLIKQMNQTMDRIDIFEKSYKENLQNMIKTEIVELSRKAMLIRQKKQ